MAQKHQAGLLVLTLKFESPVNISGISVLLSREITLSTTCDLPRNPVYRTDIHRYKGERSVWGILKL